MQRLFDEYVYVKDEYKQSSNICTKLKSYKDCKSCEKKMIILMSSNERSALKKAYSNFPTDICIKLIRKL